MTYITIFCLGAIAGMIYTYLVTRYLAHKHDKKKEK